MRAPDFWRDGGLAACALSPAGCLYAWGGRLQRLLARPRAAAMPVICVGNIVVGGAGKTPVVLALADKFAARPELAGRVHALTRGYGGSMRGPARVDATHHDFWQVGDESLLLARSLPTWVARDRVAGAAMAVAAGATLIVMDDGLQNLSLAKSLSFVVIDGGYGFGNGRVMPAGPLREPLTDGLRRTDAVVLIGEDATGAIARVAALRPDLPILRARLAPEPGSAGILAGKRVVAFAGIGRPEKFFASLREIGAEIAATESFADHHPYEAKDVARLEALATHENAVLVTTAKDAVRWPADRRASLAVLDVRLVWDDEIDLDLLLASRLPETWS